MNTLRLEFEELQKSKYNGTELMFETSNSKYIEWLEQKIVKNCNIPPVSVNEVAVCLECGAPMEYDWTVEYDTCSKCGSDLAN